LPGEALNHLKELHILQYVALGALYPMKAC